MGDINGDGLDDYVGTTFLNNSTPINIALGNGRGAFTSLGQLESTGSKGPISLADINQDGKVDLVYAGPDDGTLRTRFGNGDATFGAEVVRAQLAASVAAPGSSSLNSLELADINGDGYLDAVGGSQIGGIRIAYGDGGGTFSNGMFVNDDLGYVNNFSIVDANGDNQPDIVFATRFGADLGVLYNLRSTPALAGTNFGNGFDQYTYVACSKLGNSVVFALGENPIGTGSTGRLLFGRNPIVPTDAVAGSNFEDLGVPAIADFDGNGVLDLAYTYRNNTTSFNSTLAIMPGNLTGSPFSGAITTYATGWGATGAYAAQANADGTADILVALTSINGEFRGHAIFQNRAQSLVVSTAADENDGNARWNSGTGTSLREAIAYANAISGTRTITFAPWLGAANSVINVTNGPILLAGQDTNDVTIANTFGRITLDGNNTASTLIAAGTSTLTLRDLTIRNFRAGSLFGISGGAIYVDFDGRLNVDRVTFTGNSATGFGGAIYAHEYGFVTIRNSTFTANGGTGAIASNLTIGGSVVLENNTIVGNTGGVRTLAGSMSLQNNIIAGNGAADISGSFNGANNIIQTGGPSGLTGTIVADPRVNALAYTGGFTSTMSLQSTSPAINAAAPLSTVAVDQRGIARPQVDLPDIGAVEARFSELNLPFVTTADGATWFLFPNAGTTDYRVYRQRTGQGTLWVDGALASSIALQNDGTVVVRNAAGNVFNRPFSATTYGAGWNAMPYTTAADGATWLLGSDATGSNRSIYRWSASGAFAYSGAQGVRIGAADGQIVAQNAAGNVSLRLGSASGLGSAWQVMPRATAGDSATWFATVASTGVDGTIFRWPSNGTPIGSGGAGVELSKLSGGSIVTRTAGGEIYARIGSSAGLGSSWSLTARVTAGDGVSWFLGTEETTADHAIYRWAIGNAVEQTGGTGTRLGVIDGTVIAQVSSGGVTRRTGSSTGLGTAWSNAAQTTAGDGATWLINASAGSDGVAYRWAPSGSPANAGGIGRELSTLAGGSILIRNSVGDLYVRTGSNGGIGNEWVLTARTDAGDNAAWFLSPEDTGPDRTIYRWALGGTATLTGGLGASLGRLDGGSIVTRTSVGQIWGRAGSNNGIGNPWQVLSAVQAADGATWFVGVELYLGSDAYIYRWPIAGNPTYTLGAGLTLSVTPLGDVRTINGNGELYQAIDSRLGYSPNWRLLSESLVVTTSIDENDFSSSDNMGAGTSLREALAYAEAHPGPDTITFAPSLAGQTLSLSEGWYGNADDTTLHIFGNVTLQGPAGGVTLAIPGGTTRRHVVVESTGSLAASNLIFTGGNLPGGGGSIFNFGSLTLDNIAFNANSTPGGGGGAIYNAGTASISNSTFTSNHAGEGGAIQNTGTLNISTSTFSSNSSDFNGGALRLFGTTTIDRNTFSGNTVVNQGGALISFGSTSITNSTFAGNGKDAVLLWDGTANLEHLTVAYNANGGLASVFANTTLRNSIVAGNAGFDQTGTLAAGSSNNLLNVSASAAGLGSLAFAGGPTPTIELLPGSPAINAGLSLSTIDQRGIARPQGSASDLGAYERSATAATVTSAAFEYLTRQAVNFTFSDDASVTFGPPTLLNLDTNQPVAAGTWTFNSTGTIGTLTLTNQLPNGNYRASLGGQSVDFFILAGDVNRDRAVNFDDLLTLAQNYGQSQNLSGGDADYDGTVDFDDLLILTQNYGRSALGGPTSARTSTAKRAGQIEQIDI